MQYTLGEAAKVVGKSKAAISRAIKNHTISAEKQENGSYKIEASELHRVYPPVPVEQGGKPLTTKSDATAETRELEAKLAAATERLTDKDETIADLRQRLDRESEERRQTQVQLTALLTDQRGSPRRSWWPWSRG
jgi:molecular chaperone GrpE (heat shock protein)